MRSTVTVSHPETLVLSSSKLEVSQMDKIQSNLDLRQHSKENKKSKLL